MRTSPQTASLTAAIPYVVLAGLAVTLITALDVPLADTPDGLIHVHRTRALAEAISDRVFLPRVFPDFAFGYGYPVFHYYAPLSYYPGAAAHAAGLHLVPAVFLGAAFFLALSAVAMYAFLRVWTTPFIAFAVAAVSLAAPYRIYNLSVRGALPEYAAFAFLPLIGLAMAELMSPQKKAVAVEARSDLDARYIVLLAVSGAGLILTHNLSALMTAIALSAVGITIGLYSLLRRSEGSLLLVPLALAAAAAVVGVGLATFHALPALMELDWVGLGQSTGGDAFLNHLAGAREIFSWSLTYRYPPASEATVPAPALYLAINGALLLPLLFSAEADDGRSLRGAAGLGLLLSAVALALMTPFSKQLWLATSVVLGKLQFPWRWQMVLAFSSVWALALVLEWMRRRVGGRGVPVLYAVLAAGGIALFWSSVAEAPHATRAISEEALTTQAMWAFDDSVGQVGASWTGEFLPRWVTEQRWAIGRPPTEGADGETQDAGASGPGEPARTDLREDVESVRPVRAGYLDTEYEVSAPKPFRLVLHTFYLPAWRATVDGDPAETDAVGDLGLLAIDLPAGNYELALQWVATTWVWIGWLVSSMAWLAGLFWLLRRNGTPKWLVTSWVGGGALVLLLSLIPPRSWAPAAVGADYGPVRLEAGYAEPIDQDGQAVVDLSWFIANPDKPLTSYVHIVDASGTIVAQDDGPMAGTYTPFERWTPGMMVTRRHWIRLPSELPPDVYTVLAGVYPAGESDNPLVPLQTDDGAPAGMDIHGRVRVGSFEITE